MAFQRTSRKRGMERAGLSRSRVGRGAGSEKGRGGAGCVEEEVIEGLDDEEQRRQDTRVCWGESSAIWKPIRGPIHLSNVEAGLSPDTYERGCGCQTQEGKIRGEARASPPPSPTGPHHAQDNVPTPQPSIQGSGWSAVFSQPSLLASRPPNTPGASPPQGLCLSCFLCLAAFPSLRPPGSAPVPPPPGSQF